MTSAKPFKSINPDLTSEINALLEDIQISQTVDFVLRFMKQNVSQKRGTKQWLDNLRAIGTLLACASPEDYDTIVRTVTVRNRKPSQQPKEVF